MRCERCNRILKAENAKIAYGMTFGPECINKIEQYYYLSGVKQLNLDSFRLFDYKREEVTDLAYKVFHSEQFQNLDSEIKAFFKESLDLIYSAPLAFWESVSKKNIKTNEIWGKFHNARKAEAGKTWNINFK